MGLAAKLDRIGLTSRCIRTHSIEGISCIVTSARSDFPAYFPESNMKFEKIPDRLDTNKLLLKWI